jgi:hypothetical protein
MPTPTVATATQFSDNAYQADESVLNMAAKVDSIADAVTKLAAKVDAMEKKD